MKTQNYNFRKLVKLISFICLFSLCKTSYSQTDTLYTKTQKKIPCIIIEIGEFEIKYKPVQNPDGPVYVINSLSVFKYTMANGYTEILSPDELSVENQYSEIRNNKTVIKIQPFSFINNQFSVAYEHVIKVGMNLDFELGYINNSITPNTAENGFYTTSGKDAPCTGIYIKPGIKFLLGQDFSTKGLKYAHALKGRYIKLDLALSYMNFQDVAKLQVYYQSNYNYNYPYNYSSTLNYTATSADLNTFAYGGFVNFGRQFILGNILTVDYYIGLGVSGQSSTYKNSVTQSGSVNGNSNSYNNYYNTSKDADHVTNYHAFFRNPDIGLSYTMGFRIGYILPEKKVQPKPKFNREY